MNIIQAINKAFESKNNQAYTSKAKKGINRIDIYCDDTNNLVIIQGGLRLAFDLNNNTFEERNY